MQQEKTVIEWLEWAKEMGFSWADTAIKQCEMPQKESKSLSDAIFSAFSWNKTAEKNPFWEGVFSTLLTMEKMAPAAQTLQTSPDRATIAAMALNGVLSNPEFTKNYDESNEKIPLNGVAAKVAINAADVLIALLSRTEKK